MAQDVTFRSPTAELQGTLFEPSEAAEAPALLFVHGLGSDQAGYGERAEAVVERLGAVSLTFDLSGHGRSGGTRGELTIRNHLSDLLAAYDLLAAQPAVDVNRIGVCGASYGGYLTALMITERRAARLLLRAPALFADDDLDTPAKQGIVAVDSGPSEALERLARFDGEVLIVESALDAVISGETIRAYRDSCRRGAHEVIPDSGHDLVGAARTKFRDLIVSWFYAL